MGELKVILTLIKDIGLGICAFALCAWMIMYFVKNVTSKMESLIHSLKTFMVIVKVEHENQLQATRDLAAKMDDDHKEFAELNREQTKQGIEVTAALGRVNGFTKEGE